MLDFPPHCLSFLFLEGFGGLLLLYLSWLGHYNAQSSDISCCCQAPAWYAPIIFLLIFLASLITILSVYFSLQRAKQIKTALLPNISPKAKSKGQNVAKIASKKRAVAKKRPASSNKKQAAKKAKK